MPGRLNIHRELSNEGNHGMKTHRSVAALLAISMAGCTSISAPRTTQPVDAWITPSQAVLLAANAAPRGVKGTFRMKVRATGEENGVMFLNSELDYRDQRNLTVAVAPTAVAALQARLGGDPRVALKGRDIVVTGSAMRTRIVFSANGQPTDKYYYQTHVRVSDADQIVVD